MAEVAGTVYFGRGRDAANIKWFASINRDQINNAAGSTGTYINGKARPGEHNGYAWMVPSQYGSGAHRSAGELLYVGIKATSVVTFATANCSLDLQEAMIDPESAGNPDVRHHAVGDRVTSITSGGVADNPATRIGQITPFLALPALRPGEQGKLTGFVQVVTDGA